MDVFLVEAYRPADAVPAPRHAAMPDHERLERRETHVVGVIDMPDDSARLYLVEAADAAAAIDAVRRLGLETIRATDVDWDPMAGADLPLPHPLLEGRP